MNCELHLQPVLGYSQKDQQRKGLCHICLAEQKDDFVLTDEANQEIAQFGRWFSEQFDTLKQNYIGQLKSVIQNIHEVKTLINQSIDKLVMKMQDWIEEVSKQKQEYERLLQDMKNLNFNGFMKFVNSKWMDKEKEFQKLISGQISKFLKEKWTENCVQKLMEMQNITLQFASYPQKQQTNLNLAQTSLYLKCEQDNQLIIMMDINPDTPIDKRLACVKCIQRDHSTYISIEDTQNLWDKYELMKEKQLQLYKNKQQEKISKAKKLLEQVRFDLSQIIVMKYHKYNNINFYIKSLGKYYQSEKYLIKDQQITKQAMFAFAAQQKLSALDSLLKHCQLKFKQINPLHQILSWHQRSNVHMKKGLILQIWTSSNNKLYKLKNHNGFLKPQGYYKKISGMTFTSYFNSQITYHFNYQKQQSTSYFFFKLFVLQAQQRNLAPLIRDLSNLQMETQLNLIQLIRQQKILIIICPHQNHQENFEQQLQSQFFSNSAPATHIFYASIFN